jgi:hypothetical protein
MIKIELNSGEKLEGTEILESFQADRIALVLTNNKVVEFSVLNIKTITEHI